MVKRFLLISMVIAILIFSLVSAFAEICSDGEPLVLVNESGREITGLYLTLSGREEWSPNRLEAPLANGKEVSSNIERNSIIGLSDIRITFVDGSEVLWRKLPILEIFNLKINSKTEPIYERIKLGS
ncbi:MAG: hypothetical protein HUJ86_08050 [Synergistes sp.]|nr:hypothetical protein [Synergistes sp.]